MSEEREVSYEAVWLDGRAQPKQPGFVEARLAKTFREGEAIGVTIQAEQEFVRSSQRGLYFAYVVGALMGWSGYDKPEAHHILKKAVLGTYEKNGETFVRSTKGLKTKAKWSEFIDGGIRFLTGLGCPVHLPEDER